MNKIVISINLDDDKANIDLSKNGYSLDIENRSSVLEDLKTKGIATVPTKTKLPETENIDTTKYTRKEYKPDEVKYIRSLGLLYKISDSGNLDHLLDVLTDNKTKRTIWAVKYDADIQEVCDKYIADSQARRHQFRAEKNENKEKENTEDE